MSGAQNSSSSRSNRKELFWGGFLVVALLLGTSSCKREAGVPSGQACIDLSKFYNATLTDSLNSPAQVKENNLAGMPRGRQVFSGVPFQVEGILVLSGKKNVEWGRTEYPEAIKDIKIGRTARQFHLLHGAGGVYDGAGTAIAKLVLHYADRSERQIEIKTGEHVLDWWGDPKQAVWGKNSELAWEGTNPAMKKYGGNKPGSLRIYKTSFDNPQPDISVTGIDYVSTMHNSAPFLIALTVE